MAISAGVVLLFAANLFIAIGLETGTTGRARLQQFLAPADVAVAIGLIVAVALCVMHRPADEEVGAPATRPAGKALRAASFAMVAGIVALTVVLAALIRGIVDLTIPNDRAALKVGNLIEALVVALVAGAAALWGLRKPGPR